MRKTWYLYILECSDGTLYTGVTTDVADRLETHQQGKGAKYTRSRLPVKLLGYVTTKLGMGQSQALSLECSVKRLKPLEKRAFISGHGRHWEEFSGCGMLQPRICHL